MRWPDAVLESTSPCHIHVVCAKSLCDACVRKCCGAPSLECNQARPSNHGSVVNTVPIVRSIQFAPALFAHCLHHLLKPHVAANTSNNQDICRGCVRHGALSDFHLCNNKYKPYNVQIKTKQVSMTGTTCCACCKHIKGRVLQLAQRIDVQSVCAGRNASTHGPCLLRTSIAKMVSCSEKQRSASE